MQTVDDDRSTTPSHAFSDESESAVWSPLQAVAMIGAVGLLLAVSTFGGLVAGVGLGLLAFGFSRGSRLGLGDRRESGTVHQQ